jgi:hypothetical protein
MANSISAPKPSKSEQNRSEDGRADWERPALRRLKASEAQHSNTERGDGVEDHAS